MVVLGRALCIELYDDAKKGQNNDTLEGRPPSSPPPTQSRAAIAHSGRVPAAGEPAAGEVHRSREEGL